MIQLQSTSAGASCIIPNIQCSTLAFCSYVFTCTILCFLHHGEFYLIGEWPVHTKYVYRYKYSATNRIIRFFSFWRPFAISNSNWGVKRPPCSNFALLNDHFQFPSSFNVNLNSNLRNIFMFILYFLDLPVEMLKF